MKENLYIKKLLAQAVVSCISGDRQACRSYCQIAETEKRKDEFRNRLHASVADILNSKGQEVKYL